MPQQRTKTVFLVFFLLLLAIPCLAAVPPGRVTVYSTPTGALACIDNATCDTTGATFSVEGNAWHLVVITEKGYRTWTDSVYVTADQTTQVDAYLDLDPAATGISVTVLPGGGTICLDNTDCRANAGTTTTTGHVQFNGVSPGYHTISVEAPIDYEDAQQLVQVTLGKVADVNIELVPFVIPITPTPDFGSLGIVRVYVDHTGSTICIDNVNCYVNVGGSPGSGTGTVAFNDITTDKAHVVTVSLDGYRSVSTPVTVSKDLITTVDISLQPVTGVTTVPLVSGTGATVPPTMPTGRAAAGILPVIGALALCCAVFLFRKNR